MEKKINKKNWTHSPKRLLVVAKIVYDSFAASFALFLAFLLRFSLFYLEGRVNEIRPDLKEIYISFFFQHLPLFVGLTIGVLALSGFYKSYPKPDDRWKPFKILSFVSLGPILWSLILYYFFQNTEPLQVPRGVALLAWFNTLLFIALPRIIKYFAIRKMVFQVHVHRKKSPENILVIGGAGYIGSQLCRDLLREGYKVRILDLFLFGQDSIKDIQSNPRVDVVHGDFRNIETLVHSLNHIDAVIHLGGIVGDPACSLDDDFTMDINLTATKILADLCKAYKVERFIFASSCSVYGASQNDEFLTEESPLNPVSLYAKTKIASEKILLDATSEEFAPTILRFATLFGLSPRPRFDLFVNLVTAKAVREKQFSVFGGNQWRPFVHVNDICSAIIHILKSPVELTRAEVFNIGSDNNCLTIAQAADIVKKLLPDTKVDYANDIDDPRNYKVSFAKLRRVLGLTLDTSVEQGVKEMIDALTVGALKDYDHTSISASNLKRTQQLLTEEMTAQFTAMQLRIVDNPKQVLRRVGEKE